MFADDTYITIPGCTFAELERNKQLILNLSIFTAG